MSKPFFVVVMLVSLVACDLLEPVAPTCFVAQVVDVQRVSKNRVYIQFKSGGMESPVLFWDPDWKTSGFVPVASADLEPAWYEIKRLGDPVMFTDGRLVGFRSTVASLENLSEACADSEPE